MKTTDIFKTKAKALKESFEKTFGQKLKLETFTVTQLEDARNRLRTQIHQVRNSGTFNETIENEAYTKAQWMLDGINAELAERFEQSAIHSDVPVKEAGLNDIDWNSDDVVEVEVNGDKMYVKETEEGLLLLGEDIEGSFYTDQDGGERDGWISFVVNIDTGKTVDFKSEDEDGDGGWKGLDHYAEDYPAECVHEVKKVYGSTMDEIRDNTEGGPSVDDEGGETDDSYALASAGHGSDEDYGFESQTQGNDMTRIRESAADKAGAVVVAKDMTDKVGRWIEELSGMENDTLLSLGDTIRDEMGQVQAKAYLEAVAPAIQQALMNLKQTREVLASGMRSLTGEEQSAEIIGSEPGADGADMAAEPDMMNPEAPAGDEEFGGFDTEAPTDEFAAAEPAAGGAEEAGRMKRESIERQNTLLRVLAG